MKNILIMIVSLMPFFATAQNEIEFRADERYPEGIAFDPKTNLFYVSGVRYATVGSVDLSGKYTELLADSSLRSMYGLKVAGSKLWICCSDANYSKYRSDQTYKKLARLIAIDLDTKKKSVDIDLGSLFPGEHFANDIAFDNNGNGYVTDSYSPVIYKIDASGKAALFMESDLFKSAGVGLNGIVWHPSGFLLAVNGGTGSVLKINMDGKNVIKCKIPYFFSGGDGLLLDEEKNLVLVQNKGVNKVFRIQSKDNWVTAKIISQTKAEARFSFPSTATLRNKEVWVMNAKLHELSEENTIPSKTFTLQKAVFVAVP